MQRRRITATSVFGAGRRTAPSLGDFGLTEADLAWHEDAACAGIDPDRFYPEPGPGITRDIAAAKRVCAGCPVRAECLAYALAHDERHGIWGGTTPQERRPRKPKTAPRRQDVEVARMTRGGKTAREIACALAITPRTVVRARTRLRNSEEAA
jgi:WhiB family redox-sensing transcriptional regulator